MSTQSLAALERLAGLGAMRGHAIPNGHRHGAGAMRASRVAQPGPQSIYFDGTLQYDSSGPSFRGSAQLSGIVYDILGAWVYANTDVTHGPIHVRGYVHLTYGSLGTSGSIVEGKNVTVTIGQHTNVLAFLRATVGSRTASETNAIAPPLSIPECPPGQSLYIRYKDGRVGRADESGIHAGEDWYNVLRNNPTLRASIKEFFCQGDVNAVAPPRAPPAPQQPIPQAAQATSRASAFRMMALRGSPNGIGAGPHGGGGMHPHGGGGGGGPHMGGGGGHHGGFPMGHRHGGGFRHFDGGFRRFGGVFPVWSWGPTIVVAEEPRCTWSVVTAIPLGIVQTLQATSPTVAVDGTFWRQAPIGDTWWAAHSSGNALAGDTIYYVCAFVGLGPPVYPVSRPATTREIAIPSYTPSREFVPAHVSAHVHGRGARAGLRGDGLGDAGASVFTVAAAQALEEHLNTNNCAGCDDMKSPLRQLTFAFKAAVLTDKATTNQVSLNMSTALAMTAYGPGTEAALKLVLGASHTYQNGPCTDDSGTCLAQTNLVTPDIPQAIRTLEQQLAQQIQSTVKAAALFPQSELVSMLVQGFAALINQISFEIAKLKGQQPAEKQPVVTTLPVTPVKYNLPSPYPGDDLAPKPPAAPTTGWTTGEKIVVGVVAGAAVAGGGLLVYRAIKKRKG